MNLEHSLSLYTKVNSKWFKDLNIKLDIIKLLAESIPKTPSDINLHSIFLDPPARVNRFFPGGSVVENRTTNAGDGV